MTDRRQINEWAREFPKANIGIATGEASGIVVVDLDRKHAVDGIAAFKLMCDQLGIKPPKTYKVKTPSGGQHLYFHTKYAAKISISAGILGPGIDVRGEGGYAVAEGSVIDGKRYKCTGGSIEHVRPLPKALRLKMQDSRGGSGGNGNSDYKEGQRNDALFRDACGFRATGRSFERTLELTRGLNLSACKPPLDDKEVVGIVESAFTYENSPIPNDSGETALTDMGSARRLALANAGTLVFVSELGKYLHRARNAHWRRNDGIEYILAKKSARGLFKEVPDIDDLKTQEAVSKFAIRSQSKTLIESCLKLAQTEPELAVSIDKFDADPWLLPVQNGVVDLRTGLFRPIEEDDYFLNVSPVIYDADAECPKWNEFLKLVQPNRAMRIYLQKLVGLTLVGSATEEIIIFLYGIAGTGKSTFINAILKVMGRELAIKFSTSVLLARDRDGAVNELLPFRGARMAVASEIPEGRRFNEAMLKDLGSNDILTTRPLFKESFQFQPSHSLWLYGNHLPRVSGGDSGVWRRLSLLPFKQAIPKSKIDKEFGKTLEAELPGILNWSIAGCRAWQKSGVKRPAQVRAATTSYRSAMDVVSQFIDEQIKTRPGKDERALVVYKSGSKRKCVG